MCSGLIWRQLLVDHLDIDATIDVDEAHHEVDNDANHDKDERPTNTTCIRGRQRQVSAALILNTLDDRIDKGRRVDRDNEDQPDNPEPDQSRQTQKAPRIVCKLEEV